MTSSTHISGYAHVAERYGFEEAVFLDAIMFWYRSNRGDDRNFYDGRWWTYRCVQGHTSQADWTPDAAVSLWAKIAGPAEEWPEWSQPVGAHDAYAAGDKVSHGGKRWTSSVDGNVWEPEVYGWELVENE